MTWWQRFFYGFNTTKNEEEKRDPLKGEITSPIFVSELIEKGFHFNEERRWCKEYGLHILLIVYILI